VLYAVPGNNFFEKGKRVEEVFGRMKTVALQAFFIVAPESGCT
jgi:hypothetical protein